MYFLYILRGPKNHLYVGVTDNIRERIKRHESGDGAKFTKRNKTYELIYKEQFETYKDARKRESQIKGWRREKKENLIKFGKPIIMENQIDLTKAREQILDLASQAGETLKKYFGSDDLTHKSKGGVDFATQADYEVDAFLLEQIKKKYPGTNFLTEETAPSDFSHLKHSNNLWVIDPLDGTINFSRKHPYFAISIALVDKGLPKLAIVHIPMTGDTYWAQSDQDNAYLNRHPLKVSSTKELNTATIACDWSWDLQKRLDVLHWLENLITHVRQAKAMGSAVSDLASLASGQIDAYMNSGLKPWDIAASALLIQKSGGKITTSTGAKWDVFESSMLASNTILHKKILDLINN